MRHRAWRHGAVKLLVLLGALHLTGLAVRHFGMEGLCFRQVARDAVAVEVEVCESGEVTKGGR